MFISFSSHTLLTQASPLDESDDTAQKTNENSVTWYLLTREKIRRPKTTGQILLNFKSEKCHLFSVNTCISSCCIYCVPDNLHRKRTKTAPPLSPLNLLIPQSFIVSNLTPLNRPKATGMSLLILIWNTCHLLFVSLHIAITIARYIFRSFLTAHLLDIFTRGKANDDAIQQELLCSLYHLLYLFKHLLTHKRSSIKCYTICMRLKATGVVLLIIKIDLRHLFSVSRGITLTILYFQISALRPKRMQTNPRRGKANDDSIQQKLLHSLYHLHSLLGIDKAKITLCK